MGIFKRVKGPKTPLYENVTLQIEALILDGNLKPGDQLPPERELAEVFGVSRTCIREAIKALMAKGLVDVQHGRGVFVTRAAPVEADVAQVMAKLLASEGTSLTEFYEIRKLIEPQAAAWAAERRTLADIEAIRDACRLTVGSGEGGKSSPNAIKIWKHDTKFHLAIAAATQNQVLSRIMYGLLDLLAESRRKTLNIKGRARVSVAEHVRLADAIEAGDAAAAERFMREHLQNTEACLEGQAATEADAKAK